MKVLYKSPALAFKNLALMSLVIFNFNGYANEEAQKAASLRMQNIVIPNEMKIDLWADQTQTQNPTYLNFDSKGRLLIAEIFRFNHGVSDVRQFPTKQMLVEDISSETLQQRQQFYQDHLDFKPMSYYTDTSDKIRLLSDNNQDGRADKSIIFADGFNKPLDGLGAGVIERDGKVYYANIPNLWMLEDNDADGVAEKRTILQTGFGTRVGFLGHDMHGFAWGPDGRIYWSLGDRGYDITTKEGKHLFGPNLGAVFRANPDGSNIEIFYSGLRNPQELVFDEYGNLFTADNDGDKSDTERVNHLIEGGDSGWHAGHQSIMSFAKRLELRSYKYTEDTDVPVSWLVNRMSKPRTDTQPAFMLPGIGQLFSGPSGFAYNPSNYFGEAWRNSFFIAFFQGSPSSSYVTTFKNIPNGASFLTSPFTKFLSGFNVVDLEFGPDGRLYLSEFNYGGWDSKGEGAIYTLDSLNQTPQYQQKVQLYQNILTSDFSKKSATNLIELLSIDHQVIRQRAQFELAKRGSRSADDFQRLALDNSQPIFSRIHSIWGISQLIFQGDIDKATLKKLLPLLQDSQDQIRIQTARVLGDHNAQFANQALTLALNDTQPQVQMYAAIGLGRTAYAAAVPEIIKLIINNNDNDLWLRHSLVMALQGINKSAWIQFKNHKNRAVRLAILLALRKLNDTQVADFLNDQDKSLVDEAIIAIDDLQMLSVRENVAALLNANRAAATEAQAYIHHRMINANYNEGKLINATRLLDYAASPALSNRLASEALAAIEAWHEINPIDSITGLPTKANTTRANIKSLLLQKIAPILATVKGQALVQAMRLAEQVNYNLPNDLLVKIVQDPQTDFELRKQSLNMLKNRSNIDILALSKQLINDPSSEMMSAALAIIFNQDSQLGLSIAEQYLTSNTQHSTIQKKMVLPFLAKHSNPTIEQILIDYLDMLQQNQLAPTLILELEQAVKDSPNLQIKNRYQAYLDNLQKQDLLTQYASTLTGGNAKLGQELFHGGGAAQCIRCHRVNKQGQSNVGPNLTGVANRYNASYLLEALIDPSATIAPRYGNITLTLTNGNVISGLFIKETATEITLIDTTDSKKSVQKKVISEIQRPISGMPPMGYLLSKTQIRDLLAYLQTLTTKQAKASH